MKKIIRLVLLFTIIITVNVQAQKPVADSLVNEGIKLHDKGDYEGAIEFYTKAVAIDKSFIRANYELASTYLALKKYEKAVEYCDIVLDAKSDFGLETYILKGTIQDITGQPKEAIKTYKKGIKKFPDHYLLYYNLGYTLYAQKEYRDAEETLQTGLTLKPSHASSHLLLAYLMSDQGKRIQSVLALYNFLLLEPKSDRAATAYALLDKSLSKGVKKTGEKEITISVQMDSKSDEFSSAELMLGLMTASNSMDKNKDKSEEQLFAENTGMLFSVLGETKSKKGFWANYYVVFFNALSKANHSEALSYYISQSDTSDAVSTWLKNNQEKIDALLKWFSTYERKS